MVGQVGMCECAQGFDDKKISKLTLKTQREFIRRVQNGESPKDAFISSLSNIDKPEETDSDKIYLKQCMMKSCNLSPAAIKQWIELIGLTIPVVLSTKNVILEIIKDIINLKNQPTQDGKNIETREAA